MNLESARGTKHEIKKIVLFIFFLLFTVFIFWQMSESGWLDILSNQKQIQLVVKQFGVFGPLAIIFIIAIAIVISPIPSAPIALVSGALYGHTLGTIYVIFGAVIGALMAFIIARKLGYDYVSRRFHSYLPAKIIGSQNTMMAIIFVSRLAPFISFDVMSYVAGLTNLTLGRFFIATVMGVIPISFMLAHLGSEMIVGEARSIVWSILILGLVTIIPVLINVFMKNNNFKG